MVKVISRLVGMQLTTPDSEQQTSAERRQLTSLLTTALLERVWGNCAGRGRRQFTVNFTEHLSAESDKWFLKDFF